MFHMLNVIFMICQKEKRKYRKQKQVIIELLYGWIFSKQKDFLKVKLINPGGGSFVLILIKTSSVLAPRLVQYASLILFWVINPLSRSALITGIARAVQTSCK